MTILLLKLFLTPLMIGAVTLAGRRWGPGVSGWLMGFPLTSAPVSLILALQDGSAFAARAAIGTLGGQASVCLFCLAYGWLALNWDWPIAAGGAILAFLLATLIWSRFALALLPTFAVVLLMIGLIGWKLPKRRAPAEPVAAPRWDMPARMVIAATFVLLLTSLAATLGPQLSGLLSPFPIFGVIMATFAHRQLGAAAAIRLLRGVVLGSFAFASFFAVIGYALPALAIPWSYLLATLAALVVNSILFRRAA
ncbi:MAG TPA: hypothetical protein VGA61_14380 [Anaerolineae bacterium]